MLTGPIGEKSVDVSVARNGIEGKKIVVLHHDSSVHRRLRVMLQALKCHLFPVLSIPEAIATILRESPDLLFLAVDQPT